ncbi:hypothetical protein AB0I84_23590 [Streptomyces spectabilis]|uniref:hypothetical protein n=1 Tax=Streptomyces spectabilis TaxID=68270 RepID=UPI0033C2C87D
MTDDRTQLRAAVEVCAGLSTVALPHLTAPRPGLVEKVFSPDLLRRLPLPLEEAKPARQTVALAGPEGFLRDTRWETITDARSKRPRTRVYESVHVRSDGWYSLATLHLAGLLRRHVVCALYDSRAGDGTLGRHQDQWLGVVLQLRGAKRWLFWDAEGRASRTVLVDAGDVLVVPPGVLHDVTTPVLSTHVLFAISDVPLAPWPPASAPRRIPLPATVPSQKVLA